MAVKSVHDLLVDELRDLYHAEKQLVKALPKMAKAARSDKLRQAFEHHLEETKGQVERLETVFDKLEMPARAKRCEAMAGLIEEAQEMIEEVKTPEVLDAALVAAAQKVEHYEIASYGSARALAEALGNEKPRSCSTRPSRRRSRPIGSSTRSRSPTSTKGRSRPPPESSPVSSSAKRARPQGEPSRRPRRRLPFFRG